MKAIEQMSILVTGASDGIGRGAAAELARRGARVLLHGRDASRLSAARDAIASETGSEHLEMYVADFASLGDVRRLADEVGTRHERLDVLLNNAGIGRGPRGRQTREESTDGYELRFQVNYLAPFLLQHLLLPLLRNAAPARIVNVASVGQAPVDFDDVMLERRYDSMHAYCQSKLALVMASFELAGRLEPDAVTVNALHPGTLLDTKMVREGFGSPMGPVETGIEAEVYLATSPEVAGITGEYFDRTNRAQANAQAYDTQVRRKLWQLSEQWVGIADPAAEPGRS